MGFELMLATTRDQRWAGAGVQEPSPAGVDVFQQEPEQDQEWIFSSGYTNSGENIVAFLHAYVLESTQSCSH